MIAALDITTGEGKSKAIEELKKLIDLKINKELEILKKLMTDTSVIDKKEYGKMYSNIKNKIDNYFN